MGRRAKNTRVDEYLPLLQRQILSHQDERTEALRKIETIKTRIAEIDAEIEVMVAERDRRTEGNGLPIPDFPPIEEQIEEREDAGDAPFYDNSAFARPGFAIFLPIMGIDAPPKTKAYKEATLRVVRTWAAMNKSQWFTSGDGASDLGFSRTVVANRLSELHEMGTVIHQGHRASSKYRFVKPENDGPTTRPTHDKPTHRVGGKPVPHTRAEGPSGKPGTDKKRSGRGVKIKRQRQGS